MLILSLMSNTYEEHATTDTLRNVLRHTIVYVKGSDYGQWVPTRHYVVHRWLNEGPIWVRIGQPRGRNSKPTAYVTAVPQPSEPSTKPSSVQDLVIVEPSTNGSEPSTNGSEPSTSIRTRGPAKAKVEQSAPIARAPAVPKHARRKLRKRVSQF